MRAGVMLWTPFIKISIKMNLLTKARTHYGLLPVFSLGIGLFILQLNLVFQHTFSFFWLLLGVLGPFGLTTALIGGCIWLWKTDPHINYGSRISLLVLTSATVLTGAAVLTISYQQTQGIKIADQLVIIANSASGGALIGFIIGIYDHRQQYAQVKANRLTQQVTILNRVLRHDIRNKANVIFGHADILAEDPTDIPSHVNEIKNQATEFVEIGDKAKEIETLLHDDKNGNEVVDLASRVETICSGIQREYPSAELTISLPERLPVIAHPLIDSALSNLIQNAIIHNNKQKPKVTIEYKSIVDENHDLIEIRIADNGPGIPNDQINVLTQGYETDLNHLSGLGLWLVNWIVMKSDGEIRFQNNQPEGSIVCMRFRQADH
jgi:signal transduction histidine kinase